jgi:hypothetical protein
MAQAIAIGFTSLILTKMYNVSLFCALKAFALAHDLQQELTEAMETLEPGDVSTRFGQAFRTSAHQSSHLISPTSRMS